MHGRRAGDLLPRPRPDQRPTRPAPPPDPGVGAGPSSIKEDSCGATPVRGARTVARRAPRLHRGRGAAGHWRALLGRRRTLHLVHLDVRPALDAGGCDARWHDPRRRRLCLGHGKARDVSAPKTWTMPGPGDQVTIRCACGWRTIVTPDLVTEVANAHHEDDAQRVERPSDTRGRTIRRRLRPTGDR